MTDDIYLSQFPSMDIAPNMKDNSMSLNDIL